MVRWMLMPRLVWSSLVLLCGFAGSVQALAITFDVVALGGERYRYAYSLFNDGSLGAGVAVELFDILFDPRLYDTDSLTIVTPDPPAGDWSEVILSPAPGIPAAYDALALAGGISAGTTVSGFTVAFRWLGGPARPGAQPWQIFDPSSFALLEEGTTGPQQPTPIPEPSPLVLLSAGLIGLARWRNTARSTHA
jgi:hypothetical protein